MIQIDPFMLQVTKKIEFDENIMSWRKYYELKIKWIDKSTTSWGKSWLKNMKNLYIQHKLSNF